MESALSAWECSTSQAFSDDVAVGPRNQSKLRLPDLHHESVTIQLDFVRDIPRWG